MIRVVKMCLCGLYNVWFYALAATGIIICLPLFFIFSLKEEWYPAFYWVARNIWAKLILMGMGLIPKIEFSEPLIKGKNYMLTANHKSMIDVMLMLQISKNPIVFVGKKELERLPVFGYFYQRVCIMVDRENSKSRAAVYGHAERRLKQGLSLCIFAEGLVTSPDIKLAPFKNGVFRFSIHYQIPIVPMSFYDCERRYPYHFSYNYFVGGPGILRAKVHNHIETKGLNNENMESLKQKVYDFMLKDLEPML
jgi:1-acyl-sn-glycerol-3-phosphate acyltransferase